MTAINSVVIAFTVLLIVLWLVRWRLMANQQLTSSRCPRCGGRLRRTHRRGLDHLIGLYIPVLRYECSEAYHWKGLRIPPLR